MKRRVAAICFLFHQCAGFSPPCVSTLKSSALQMNSSPDVTELNQDVSNQSNRSLSRRDLAKSFTSSLFTAGVFSTTVLSHPDASSADATGATIWKTGKAPEVPGQKPKDKSDTKGTRKDPNFLRSIADCKGKCENSPGPDGLARSSAECLSTCQDICCTTYEQCTFAIIAR